MSDRQPDQAELDAQELHNRDCPTCAKAFRQPDQRLADLKDRLNTVLRWPERLKDSQYEAARDALVDIGELEAELAAREQEKAEMALQNNRLLRVLRDTEQQLQDAQTENAALRGVLAEVLREQAKQLDVILARLQRLKDSASVSVPPQRDVVRDALERLVADLETNSEAGAPDYAHDALKQSVPSQDTNE